MAAEIRLLWTPWPYRAGFCITDDCDATTLDSLRAVYDFLRSVGLPTTRTVWAFEPEEPCGIPATPLSILRGVTLADPGLLDYCRELSRDGFEICLHGASAGNNRRDRTIAALDLIDREFGGSDTWICHAKNADNPYWEHRVAPGRPLQAALRLYSRHRCSGEDPNSPYYWGDVCRDRIRYVRLFRTRNPDTLAENPSMPYFEASKPFVRSWFTATKRSFADCTTPHALARLKKHNGLTVLYQYLHRYYDPDTGKVEPGFRVDAERLAADTGIWKATVSTVMTRLRALQGVFGLWRGNRAWLVNTNQEPVPDLQLLVPARFDCPAPGGEVGRHGRVLRIHSLPADSVFPLEFDVPVRLSGPRCARVDAAGRASLDFGHGRMCANVGRSRWVLHGGVCVEPNRFLLKFRPGLEDLRPMSCAGSSELLRLFLGQMRIVLGEHLRKGRSLSTDRFLGSKTIRLEDHAVW
jgi:hypothetical protein